MKLSHLLLRCALISAFTMASSASFAEVVDSTEQTQAIKNCSSQSSTTSSETKCSGIQSTNRSTNNASSQGLLIQTSYTADATTDIKKRHGIQSIKKDALAILIKQLEAKYPPTPVAY